MVYQINRKIFKMKKYNLLNIKTFILLIMGLISFFACKKLDRKPIIGDNASNIYNTANGAKQVLAKLYAGLSTSGQDVTDKIDIFSNDAGANTYFRNIWIASELTTDEAVITWTGDGDLQQYNRIDFNAKNSFVELLYNRLYFQIAICNEFIRQTTDDKMKEYGVPNEDMAAIKTFRGEARFLRALAYYHAMEFFGNIPFVTDKDKVGIFLPDQKNASDVFAYIESELKDIESSLPAPRGNEYGRVDQAGVWTLLAKMYLNAKTYTGAERNADVITYCDKVIGQGGYSLPSAASKYTNIFRIDNRNTNEIIFPIRANGLYSQSYGNATFLVHAAIGGTMSAAEFGVNGGWGGLRTKPNLVDLFTSPLDKRGNFHTPGQKKNVDTLTTFSNGYGLKKFYNKSSIDSNGTDKGQNFVDLDFPLFRYSDVLLMYAEAHLRGGGGNAGNALTYVNAIRSRAYEGNAGNIGAGDLNLNFILDERGRELHWEGYRRADLIRFNKYLNGYNWPWKGGISSAGNDLDSKFKFFPIPSSDITTNPKLVQNPGY
jgi:starch-binding outer membrane protein, SusD/RagB family